MDEIWKPVAKYDGLYSVSNTGKVRSNPKVITDKLGRNHPVPERILVQSMNEWGYLWVGLTMDGKRKHCKVHRLIAEAFVKNPEMKEFVNHIDGDKTNNAANNLEWVTSAENQRHAFLTGLNKQKFKKACVRSDGKKYSSLTDAANDLGVKVSCISNVCNGKRKTCKTYAFKFCEP